MSDPTAAAADLAPEALAGHAPAGPGDKPRSLGQDAWEDLRRNPLVIVAGILILILVTMAIAPGLFTSKSPHTHCDLNNSRKGPSGDAWFGYDLQGCDVYTLTVYGARASILVGVLTSLVVAIVGGTLGILAGFYGGWIDSFVSRITDVFFGIPFLLGSILVLTSFPSGEAHSFWAPVLKVVLGLAVLGWPSLARIMRATVLQVKSSDYVAAARALGAPTSRILRVHVLPNAIQPVIVYATILLGAFIGAEASLSYLGVGLQNPAVSWGIAISTAQGFVQASPHMLLFPATFLSVTVLAFIMLGDAVRDALDPKQSR
ncbi:MAG TPA: ABC transporter permease [Sporichthya sp.]|nr:ABC transporter permease [Sporichthya sp.]